MPIFLWHSQADETREVLYLTAGTVLFQFRDDLFASSIHTDRERVGKPGPEAKTAHGVEA